MFNDLIYKTNKPEMRKVGDLQNIDRSEKQLHPLEYDEVENLFRKGDKIFTKLTRRVDMKNIDN